MNHDVRGADRPAEIRREFDRREIVALGDQSRLAAHGFAQLRPDDEQLRLDLDVVQRRQNLAFPDEIALAASPASSRCRRPDAAPPSGSGRPSRYRRR